MVLLCRGVVVGTVLLVLWRCVVWGSLRRCGCKVKVRPEVLKITVGTGPGIKNYRAIIFNKLLFE